ncbi:hypothetical protein GCM10010405_45500 [Streptomyces macrosporus]|uniref:Pyrrolo-quinoline quinone repeat domain-containing protein n=1 Tax=Streptomyces macrosporus TaxID=44032 RepID=A0ABP5XHS5_9ACTN
MVAVLLVVGGGVWFLTEDDAGAEAGRNGNGVEKEHDGRFEAIWKTGSPDTSALPDKSGFAYGTWFVGGNLVRALFDSVVAYDLDTGEEVWSLDVTRGASCAAAPGTSDGRTVLQWGARCEKVMGIDLAEGEELWRDDLPSEGGGEFEFDFTQMAVGGDTATVAWGDKAFAYDLATGRPLWSTAEDAECRDLGHVGGKRLVAHVDCGYGESQEIHSLKPDGRKNWKWKAPEGVEINRIFSVDPVVVGVTAGGETEMTDIVVLDDEGKVRSKIGLGSDRYWFSCWPSHELAGCRNVVVDKANDALYLQSNRRMDDEDGLLVSEVVAFDLSTGTSKWLSEPTRKGQAAPLAMDGGKLIGYEPPTPDEAGRITSIDPATGETTLYAELPDNTWKAEFRMNAGMGRPYWHDGGFFLVAHEFVAENGTDLEGLMAFG